MVFTNFSFCSSVGNTALTYACCGGYEEVVHTLLKARADVEHQNDNGHTPLMEAASCGHVGMYLCLFICAWTLFSERVLLKQSLVRLVILARVSYIILYGCSCSSVMDNLNCMSS